MTITTFNTIPDYIYGSPRYHSITNYPTVLVPEDYSYIDSSQGSYDLHYPLYNLTTNPIPKLEIVDQKGNKLSIQGSLQLKLAEKNYKTVKSGKTNSTERPQNSNLQENIINYDSYISIKLNPGWCYIQEISTKDKDNPNKLIFKPRFLIRTLGTNSVISKVHSIPLENISKSNKSNVASTAFSTGIIVSYNNLLWKCLKSTVNYPPKSYKIKVPEWQILLEDNNPFKVDLFVINGDRIEYVIEIIDTKRKFRPNTADSSLLTWNLSYYH
jgi:hypothetical protein